MKPTSLQLALGGLKRNLVPGLALQSIALAVVLAYFQVPAMKAALGQLAVWKEAGGYLFAIGSTSLMGGIIPFLVLIALGRQPADRWGRDALFFVLFWGFKGVEIDTVYRLQAILFGSEPSVLVIAKKTFVDQVIYNLSWAAPTQTFLFLWKDCNYSLEAVRLALRERSFPGRILTVLLSTWMVWVPTVAIVYSLPTALQLPVSNLVLCFWCLLLSFVTQKSAS